MNNQIKSFTEKFKIYFQIKLKFALIISGLIFLLSNPANAQSITYEEFLNIASQGLNIEAVEKLRENFPKKFNVTALDIGDFSGDGKNDFAIGVMPPRSRKNIFIYLFADSLNNYELIFSDTLKFHELPVEIGFSIENQICFLTHKIADRNWEIKGYTFLKNEFAEYDFYETDKLNLKKNIIVGEEKYTNFKTLQGFNGFFDINTLKELKKISFVNLPVYDLKRNVYKGFKRSVEITDDLQWKDEDNFEEKVYGKIHAAKTENALLLTIDLSEIQISEIDSVNPVKYEIYFDRSLERVKLQKRNKIGFRENADAESGGLEIDYFPFMNNFEVKLNFGKSFSINKDEVQIDFENFRELKIQIPLDQILPAKRNSLGFFTSINIPLKGKENLILKNSNGNSKDPSSYGRLIFIDRNEYFGKIVTGKFEKLILQMKNNAILPVENIP